MNWQKKTSKLRYKLYFFFFLVIHAYINPGYQSESKIVNRLKGNNIYELETSVGWSNDDGWDGKLREEKKWFLILEVEEEGPEASRWYRPASLQ